MLVCASCEKSQPALECSGHHGCLAVPVWRADASGLIPAKDFGPVWTGFYVGAAFGAGGTFNRLDIGGPGLNTSVHGGGQSGVLGSIYGGVDYQITQRGLVGLLAEASYAGLNGSVSASAPGAFAQVNQNTGFGWAVLLCAGFLADPSTLLYFTGGYAGHIVNTNGTVAVPGGTARFSTNNTMNGWTFGPGFETMLTNKLSAKLEYRYSQFGRQTIGSTGISMEPSTRAIRAGLSYRFGGLGVVSSDQSFAGSSQPFNWTGVYLGGAVGGGLGFAQTSFNSGSQGLLGGFFGGGDWQFSPQALVGVMADYTFQGITGGINLTTPGGGAYATAEQNRQWSVMGRLGWLAAPSTLLYAAGGYSQLNVRASAGASLGGAMAFAQRDTSFSGFTVGPGYRDGGDRRLDDAAGVSLQPVRAEGSDAGRDLPAVEPYDPCRYRVQVRGRGETVTAEAAS